MGREVTWRVDPRGHHQASDDAADPEHRREHEHLSERSGQELGRGHRNDEERIHEHDADHADAGDDGEGEPHVMNDQRPRDVDPGRVCAVSIERREDETTARGAPARRRPRSRRW
jgi:hypothetical protein